MQDISSASRKSLPNSEKGKAVDFTAETPASIIESIIGPRVQLGTKLEEIADKTGITLRRVRAYWAGEVAKPRRLEIKALLELRDEVVQSKPAPSGFVDWAEFERLKAEKDAEIAELRADLARVAETIALAAALGARGFSAEARREMEATRRVADGA